MIKLIENIQTRYDHFGDHHFTHPPILNAPHHNQWNVRSRQTDGDIRHLLQFTAIDDRLQQNSNWQMSWTEPIFFGQAFPLKSIFRIKAKVITTTHTDEGRNIMILSSSCSSRTSLYWWSCLPWYCWSWSLILSLILSTMILLI